VLTVRHKIEISSYVTVLTIVKDSYTESPFTKPIGNTVTVNPSGPRQGFF